MKKKIIGLLVAGVLMIGAVVAGTMAWLTDETENVTNTFTVGDINIDLKEHDYKPEDKALDTNIEVTSEADYLFVPGDTLPKDPFVRIAAGSEACYVFLRVQESNNILAGSTTDKIIEWSVDTTVWQPLQEQSGYWYCIIDEKVTNVTTFNILTDEEVTMNTAVTKDMVGNINQSKPQLIFTAAAVQKDHIANVNEAWDQLPTSFTTTNGNS